MHQAFLAIAILLGSNNVKLLDSESLKAENGQQTVVSKVETAKNADQDYVVNEGASVSDLLKDLELEESEGFDSALGEIAPPSEEEFAEIEEMASETTTTSQVDEAKATEATTATVSAEKESETVAPTATPTAVPAVTPTVAEKKAEPPVSIQPTEAEVATKATATITEPKDLIPTVAPKKAETAQVSTKQAPKAPKVSQTPQASQTPQVAQIPQAQAKTEQKIVQPAGTKKLAETKKPEVQKPAVTPAEMKKPEVKKQVAQETKKSATQTVAKTEPAKKAEEVQPKETEVAEVKKEGYQEDVKFQEFLTEEEKMDLKLIEEEEIDIPLIYPYSKSKSAFVEYDVPEELTSDFRTWDNKHVPKVIQQKDIQEMAKKAIDNNNVEQVRAIVNELKNPDFVLANDKTLLNYAIFMKRYQIMNYLIFNGADINLDMPIYTAVKKGDAKALEILLERNVDVDVKNYLSKTPLMVSIESGNDEIALLLIRFGANPRLLNKNGENALDLARRYQRIRVEAELLKTKYKYR